MKEITSIQICETTSSNKRESIFTISVDDKEKTFAPISIDSEEYDNICHTIAHACTLLSVEEGNDTTTKAFAMAVEDFASVRESKYLKLVCMINATLA